MSPDSILVHADCTMEQVICGFTCRGGQGGNHFNLALHVNDDPARVVANREYLCEQLGIPFDSYTCAEQIHGSRIETVSALQKGRGRLSQERAIPGSDALITNEPGIMLNIFVADCVPIILHDCSTGSGGVCHAGWKGTGQNILLKTVEAMVNQYGADPVHMKAYIGPSIGKCCYRVGKEVKTVLEESFTYEITPFEEKTDGLYCDLKSANHSQLIMAGLKDEHISISPDCTCCSGENYHSHRKSGEQAGRFSAFFYIRY